MKTTNYIIIATLIALLVPTRASANVYEDRLKEAFDDIISAVSSSSQEHLLTIYSDPETGTRDGQLDVYKFTIDRNGMELINNAKRVYEQVNGNANADVYTLWINDNGDWNTQGYRIYYNPDETIVVGLACDHCYTVGFVAPDDKQHRTTYTLEWSNLEGCDSITGRLITTYAPIKAKANDGHRLSSIVISSDDYDKYMEQFQAGMEKYQAAIEKAQGALSGLSDGQSHSFSFSSSSSSSSSHNNAKDWMKKLLFYVEKLQDDSSAHYIYLSKLYELCKDTEGLDQMDLKIGMRQLASVYKQLKEKKKTQGK